jgi:hypothetical protein
MADVDSTRFAVATWAVPILSGLTVGALLSQVSPAHAHLPALALALVSVLAAAALATRWRPGAFTGMLTAVGASMAVLVLLVVALASTAGVASVTSGAAVPVLEDRPDALTSRRWHGPTSLIASAGASLAIWWVILVAGPLGWSIRVDWRSLVVPVVVGAMLLTRPGRLRSTGVGLLASVLTVPSVVLLELFRAT